VLHVLMKFTNAEIAAKSVWAVDSPLKTDWTTLVTPDTRDSARQVGKSRICNLRFSG